MAELREGHYGFYYGCTYNESHVLTRAQMQTNAKYVHRYFTLAGWTPEAIAGLLGNMEWESSINPGRWQSDRPGALSSGYSLTQWTPASKYINWCHADGKDPSEMDNALERITWELENGEQYYKTPGYPLTFRQFSQSTDSPYYLACAFAWNYERSSTVLYGTEAEKEALRKLRGNSANAWYEYLTGLEPPDDPVIPDEPVDPIEKKRMSLLLMWSATRRRF